MTAPHFKPLTCEIALERLDAAWLNPLPEETVDADLFAARASTRLLRVLAEV